MHIYNVTCRIPELVGGFIFQNTICPEKIYNFIVQEENPITNDSGLEKIKKLAQEKFGGIRKVKSDWTEFEYEPDVEVINISYLGEHYQ